MACKHWWKLFEWQDGVKMDEQVLFIVTGDKVMVKGTQAVYEVLEVEDEKIKIRHLNALTHDDILEIHPKKVLMLLECGHA